MLALCYGFLGFFNFAVNHCKSESLCAEYFIDLAKVKRFREAQQISVILLLPILALVFAQASGALIFGPLIVAALIGVFALLNLIIFYASVKMFKREEILAKPA